MHNIFSYTYFTFLWLNLYDVSLECQDDLGMQNGLISDTQISASSQWDTKHAANQARLHLQKNSGKTGCWSSATRDTNQWLQIDVLGMGNKYTRITGVATQGRNSSHEQWVSKYKLQHSNDGVTFQYYREQGQTTDKVSHPNPRLERFSIECHKLVRICSGLTLLLSVVG